ncbi:PhoU domain-containing protein [Mycoplasma bradburyae]|uniref:Phosphate ABC transporter n=1 Tax=Mycoplasma bradburyae TaxID=2963128 RepID=A0AAW6HRW1_9MOLU|nr:PhoU domain-containing protein [Mycoplasma bradburyae]MDC4163262.1 phosphate ABC transporter [Mycoplasma bradburyae]MDC4181876.1 phosphate ABC transporter [Mycoplasma bradburyae]MDC4182575.1 phosphate ABC transporter [Mycoplasma bradburyae]MDC4183253.1 phosphate ABC transporter [Mycoplasma bradburyae]MDC4184059.1 phosphate ABC transporter [Mycoplasma bradburyae]
MSRNYKSLKYSEQELINKFYEYIDHGIAIHEKLLIALNKYRNGEDYKEVVKEIFKMEKISNIKQADLLDDSTWIISKEQPQASHLRFIIAIISSSNDIERICDYANNVAKFLNNNDNISNKKLDIVIDLQQDVIKNYKDVIEHLKQNEAEDTYKFADIRQQEFESKYKRYLRMFKQYDLNSDDELQLNLLIDMILMIKYIERINDHLVNIVEYFVYIKESSFFFDKKI